MIYLGIVGAEDAKFTLHGKAEAIKIIKELLESDNTILVSGHCHLGGVDIWAEEIAGDLNRGKVIFPPKELGWENGYKPRNLQIAHLSDIVHCIAVDQLPHSYKGMRFTSCYHCQQDDHVKSGGCWTMKKAKEGQLHIVTNYPE